MDDPTRRTLAPAQERTLEMLRRGPEPIVFDPDPIEALSTTMTDALEHLRGAAEETRGPDREVLQHVRHVEHHEDEHGDD